MAKTDMVCLKPEVIETKRLSLGLTLEEFGRRTNLSHVTLRIARKGQPISLPSANRIARALRSRFSDIVSSANGGNTAAEVRLAQAI